MWTLFYERCFYIILYQCCVSFISRHLYYQDFTIVFAAIVFAVIVCAAKICCAYIPNVSVNTKSARKGPLPEVPSADEVILRERRKDKLHESDILTSHSKDEIFNPGAKVYQLNNKIRLVI